MNLRKDHLHECPFQNPEFYCEFMKASKGVGMAQGRLAEELDVNLITLAKSFLGFFVRFRIYHITTFSDGCLGSSNDEGRSKMR